MPASASGLLTLVILTTGQKMGLLTLKGQRPCLIASKPDPGRTPGKHIPCPTLPCLNGGWLRPVLWGS